MNASAYFKELLPKTINYRFARWGLLPPTGPVTLTFSVTNVCQSRCKTCRIWELYLKTPEKMKEELTIGEIEKIFKSMGHVYFLNISGGEPFLRKDLPQIIKLATEYLKPGIVHIPTNAIASEVIETKTREILKILKNYNSKVPLTIKPSFDGVGDEHDQVRGVKGNFEKVLDTVRRLKKLNAEYPGLHIELGTVISRANMDRIEKIADYAHSLGIESYRNEIAEQRSEFFNKEDPITPSAQEYRGLINKFSRKIRENIKGKRKLTRLTESLRLVYYDIAVRIMEEKRQVIPCFGGISNVHMTPYGDLWPCCVLGYDKPLGNLREAGYDFKKVWHSKKADEVRKSIKNKECWCPLANQAYSNILCNAGAMFRVLANILKY